MAVAGGQCRDAVRRRFANAAERQGGGAPATPDVRGEKARVSARKRREEVVDGFVTDGRSVASAAKGVCGTSSMEESWLRVGISA